MKTLAILLTLLSIIIVFFNYHIAIIILSIAMLFFGIQHLMKKAKVLGMVYFVAGFLFIVGMVIAM